MKRFLLTCIISLFALTPAWATRPAILDSIMGLQIIRDGAVSTICTVGKVSPTRFLTAAHCYKAEAVPYFINSHPASLLKQDTANDLALFEANDVLGKTLKLSKTPLDYGDYVETAGRPLGFATHFFSGRVARPVFIYPGDTQRYVIFDMHVAGGQSGSPIVNKKGELVSVMQVGLGSGNPFGGEPFSDMSGGVPLDALTAFLKNSTSK